MDNFSDCEDFPSIKQFHIPLPVKLILGMLAAQPELFEQACHKLVSRWGELELLSPISHFDHSDYYRLEMGGSLLRQYASFQNLIEPQDLGAYKLFSNQVEESFAQEGKRLINLDPGYLAEGKLVLASGKNYAHRIYLGEGIYAELTLQYKRQGGWQDLPWTYPDYRLATTKGFFLRVRQQYRQQLRSGTY